jgi:hypothetical protein
MEKDQEITTTGRRSRRSGRTARALSRARLATGAAAAAVLTAFAGPSVLYDSDGEAVVPPWWL